MDSHAVNYTINRLLKFQYILDQKIFPYFILMNLIPLTPFPGTNHYVSSILFKLIILLNEC